MPMISRSDFDLARHAMRFYRANGYAPVPSRMHGKKAPLVKIKPYWELTGPHWWLDFDTTNIQVMTGTHWRLVAIDLDGPIALELWRLWTLHRPIPPTWEVATDPGQGKHLWFTLPDHVTECPSRILWELDAAKHAAIELKADRALITAPPSIHVKTGMRYEFVTGHCPRTIRRPATIPSWLLYMSSIHRRSVQKPETFQVSIPMCRPSGSIQGRLPSCEVIEAITDKQAVAASWGLSIVSNQPDRDGWLECRVIGCEDRTPSASFNVHSGYYYDHKSKQGLNLFETAVALGQADTWQTVCSNLAERYLAPRNHHASRSGTL